MKQTILFFILILFVLSCTIEEREIIDRHSKLPGDVQKMTPEMDLYPPVLHSDEYETPVPLAVVNTAGGEDSPFVYGNDLYFFFTPDVRVPVEKQVIDGVTGIYVSKNINQEPERVYLQDIGKLSLDGCAFIKDDKMWFCTAREGYTGLHWGTALLKEGVWSDWKVEDFNPEHEVGELHMYENELYYHSSKEGGKGGTDIWMLNLEDGEWVNPVNIEAVNTPDNDGYPYITPDGNEMWINRWYQGTPAVFRSKRINGKWEEPELIVSQFAGEPTLDKEGNLYFVHHYYKDSVMIEADIYVAYKK